MRMFAHESPAHEKCNITQFKTAFIRGLLVMIIYLFDSVQIRKQKGLNPKKSAYLTIGVTGWFSMPTACRTIRIFIFRCISCLDMVQ